MTAFVSSLGSLHRLTADVDVSSVIDRQRIPVTPPRRIERRRALCCSYRPLQNNNLPLTSGTRRPQKPPTGSWSRTNNFSYPAAVKLPPKIPPSVSWSRSTPKWNETSTRHHARQLVFFPVPFFSVYFSLSQFCLLCRLFVCFYGLLPELKWLIDWKESVKLRHRINGVVRPSNIMAVSMTLRQAEQSAARCMEAKVEWLEISFDCS